MSNPASGFLCRLSGGCFEIVALEGAVPHNNDPKLA